MKFATSLLLVLVSMSALAQKMQGQIFYADKTVDVTLIIPSYLISGEPRFINLQNRIKYLEGKSKKKKKLFPKNAVEVRFVINGREERLVSNAIHSNDRSKTFVRLLIDGEVRLYEYFYMVRTGGGPNMPGGSYVTSDFLVQKNLQQLQSVPSLGFKKKMSEYFKDCPSLVDLIQGKEFKRRDFEEIVLFYNKQCSSSL